MALFGAPTYGSLYPIPTVRRHAYIYAYRIAYLYIYERACKWLAHVRRASNRDLRLYRTPEMLKRDALNSPEDEDTVCDLKQMCAIREVILSFERRTFVRSTCNWDKLILQAGRLKYFKRDKILISCDLKQQ